jgi:cysteine desulfuration protein SufE
MEATHQTDDFIVKGCQSKVWLFPQKVEGKIVFEADSNTEITKGLVSLLVQIWSNRTSEEILNSELYFIDKIGMSRMIGSQRSNEEEWLIILLKLVVNIKTKTIWGFGVTAETVI